MGRGVPSNSSSFLSTLITLGTIGSIPKKELNHMSSNLLARTGRHRQRYDNDVRLVSGCIPYRVATEENSPDDDDDDIISTRLEVLMVSSPNRTDLVFPKGGWEDDETMLEAASREALEEAGVRGLLSESPLGVWEFRSKSSQYRCSQGGGGGGCRGYMFALEVTEELESWPERGDRDRKWLSIEEAFELCRYEWMREALARFKSAMDEEDDEINEEMIETHPVCRGQAMSQAVQTIRPTVK